MNNINDNIPSDLPDEQFDQLVNNEQVSIERIVSKGHASPASGWYDQDSNEWVMVVSGEAILSFEDGVSVSLKPGDFVDIEAHRRHRVVWTAPDVETIWLAVHY